MWQPNSTAIFAASLLAGFAVLGAACENDSLSDDQESTVPAGVGLVCIHHETPADLRDAMLSAVEASRADLLPRCPGGSEIDSPVVAFPGFDPASPEVAAGLLGRIVRSTDGGFEPVRIAVLRPWPTDPAAAAIAIRKPVVPSLFYCAGGSCVPVQHEAYVPSDMNRDALVRRIEEAAGIVQPPEG